VRGNVILEGKDIDDANPRGWGMWFANIKSGRVSHNVIANSVGHYPIAMTLDGNHEGDEHASIGVRDLVVERNIFFNWGVQLRIDGNAAEIRDVELRKNDFQDAHTFDPLVEHLSSDSVAGVDSAANRFYSPLGLPAWIHVGAGIESILAWMAHVGDTTSISLAVPYVDPDRSLATYGATLGAAPSLHAFLAEAREQGRTHWQVDYTAPRVNRYLRLGFQVSGQ
ncbi:MAG: hypothetical protein ACKVWV_00205, partial [Planctomycetota bacterium]